VNTFKISHELQERIGQAAHQHHQSVETYLDTLLAVETKSQQTTAYDADVERKLIDDVLYFLARQGWQQKGESFFRALVQYLVQTLPVEYAFVTEFADVAHTKARTLVYHAQGQFRPDFEYSIANTPCEIVLTKTLCNIPHSVRGLYPLDTLLQTEAIEAYANVPLWDVTGNIIGQVIVMSRQPFQKPTLINAVLQIVAVRTAHELERIQYAASLQSAEQFVRSTLDGLSAHIAIVATDGTILATNHAWKQFAVDNGATSNVSEHANYLAACDAATGDDSSIAQNVAAAIRSILRGQQSEFTIEYPCHAPDEKRWFVCRITRFPDDEQPRVVIVHIAITEQKLSQIELEVYRNHLEELVETRTTALALANLLLLEEVTERRHAEQVLQEEKYQSELILKNIAGAVLLADRDGNVLYVNPGWEHVTGYHINEVIGQNLRFLKSGRTPTSTYNDLWRTILAGEIWSGLLFNRRKDGVEYDAFSTIVPVLEADGTVRNYVEVHRDITQERKLIAMKEAFIANAAHDLGNPVAVLQTSLHLLRRNPAQLEKRIGIIETQVERLFALIRDLLMVSRLDRQMMVLQLAPLDVNTVIEPVIQAQKALTDERGQRLIFTPYTPLPGIMGDYEQIERVVVNLISNAMNYTPAGGQIDVQTHIEQSQVVISIKDTGIGIAPDDMPQIFDRFFRSDNANLTMHGTGLGLAIVHDIVDLHHGSITVESNLNAGTTFYVRLPIQP
jgi:two-component system CheB/CheR fusion protein